MRMILRGVLRSVRWRHIPRALCCRDITTTTNSLIYRREITTTATTNNSLLCHRKLVTTATTTNSLIYRREITTTATTNNSLICHRKLVTTATTTTSTANTNDSLIPEARERLVGLGEGEVTLVKDDASGIATITLSNEHKKNALSGRMMVQLSDITEELQSWSTGRAVILCSAGEMFCSGGDLTTVRAISNPHDGLLMSTLMHASLLRLYRLPYVTVCLVHGKGIGGGAELTTATDYRVFTETGEVAFVQSRMGVATGWGGGTRLVRILGPSAALNTFLTCGKFNATKALEVGLADHVVDSENRTEETKTWLAKFISHEPEVIQGFKRIVVGARDLPIHESMLNERQNFSPLWGGPANVKALGKNIKHK